MSDEIRMLDPDGWTLLNEAATKRIDALQAERDAAHQRAIHLEVQRDALEAERDAALARGAYLQQEYDEAHNVIEAGLERESAALAQVEALRGPLQRLVDVCAGRWLPAGHGFTMEERDVALATAAQALSSHPAPAVYTREQVERAADAAKSSARQMAGKEVAGEVEDAFWAALDAQPAEEDRKVAEAQVEGLREALAVSEDKLREKWGTAEPPYAEAYGFLAQAVRDTLSFTPAPAVYTREQVERALVKLEGVWLSGRLCDLPTAFWAALDAQPAEEEKP